MKYMLLLPLLAIGNLFTMHEEYRLASSETITQQLETIGFHHFAKESGISTLGNKVETPILLTIQVDGILQKYNRPRETTFDQIMNPDLRPKCPTKSDLLLILLKDHPTAIQALKNNYNGVFLK